jgi:LmbE family N-acetylglucosaminyl deacetylase
VKRVIRKRVLNLAGGFRQAVSPQDLAAPAIVFSPHPDDETLGCGGTIARKKKYGADVHVVFMTDGSASHRRFLSAADLRVIRRREALSACRVLGVNSEDVSFLDFEDGRLGSFHEAATENAAGLIRKHVCEQVFVPYAGDTTPDHRATRGIVLAALRSVQRPMVVYEYPVWFWRHWPWAAAPVECRRDLANEVVSSALSFLRLIRHLRWCVPIEDALDQKRAALNEHRSQTTRLLAGSPPWPILSDVSDGDFLDCFFQTQEVFYRHTC